jgi:multicomponent Na+:H+ antiporter subunit D
MHLALAALCVGIGVRTAFIPFHTWLPEAHAYAPHPVSAILSGAMIKISFFAMVRIVLQFGGSYLMQLLMWIGAVTALAAVISALAQTDVKRLLAYHSISQLGYILAVFGAGTAVGLTASFLHALNHALFKSLLFLTVGAAVTFTGQRNLDRIHGMGSRMPAFAAAFFAGALSISGIPPFNGYASKAFITLGMKGTDAYALLWVTGFLTMASFIKLGRAFLPASGGNSAPQGSGPLPGRLQTIVVAALALMCLASGVFGVPVASFLHSILHGRSLEAYPSLFSGGSLLGTLVLIPLAILAYYLVLTDVGRGVSRRVRALAPQLRMVLVFFFVGLLVFAAVAY